MHNYRRLEVWRRARSVTTDVYRVTATFPKTELFGLTAQMRHAGISIGANLAEGSGRASDQDFARFISMAIGSASELEAETILAGDLGMTDDDTAVALGRSIDEVRRMLNALRRSLAKY
ncbi:MAG TPA: four helix bundle protein [Acidimicrobiia bacterium]|jgi:four helix bundle protein|nr:four helix bundle protein [Acidimicrobiia bacterium]